MGKLRERMRTGLYRLSKPDLFPITAFIIAAMVCMTASTGAAETNGVSAFVSITPQRFFVEHIGGNLVQVQVMVPPAASPHTYEPKPRQMAALAKADVYFAIGVPFEHAWLPKIAAINPHMTIVHTDNGIDKLAMREDHNDDHQDETPDNNHDEGIDPHIWLSPPLVKIQAQHIRDALITVDPAHSADYQQNYRHFQAELQTLDSTLKEELAPYKGTRFMVFHPTWGYFADAYGLIQIPIEIGGKAPKPAQLQTIISRAKEIGIKAILVQPQFSTKSAEIISKALGGRIIVADPLSADWDTNLRQLSQQLQKILK